MRALTVATSIVLLAAPAAAQQPAPVAPPASPASPPQIVVSATGETRVTPDRATIFVGVQTRAATAAQASAENSRKQRGVIDTLRALGIAPEQISTVNYNVYPEQSFNPQAGDKAPRVTGYNVTNTVRVDVRRLDQLGALMDAAIRKGGNEVSSLQFYSSNVDEARRAALAQAVSRARADAEALATAAGGRLGVLLELDSGIQYSPRPIAAESMMMRTASAAPTPIDTGEQPVTAAVTARWSFVAGAK